MLNIPEAIKTLYKQDSIRKNFRVHFPNGEMPDITNANIVSESVSFTESLCSQQYLKFGLTEASEIQFETVGIGNMLGMTIECYNEIDVTQMPGADDPVEQYHLKDDTAIVTASYFANGATESDGTWTYKRVGTTANFKNSDGSYYMPEVGDYAAYEAEGTAWQIETVGYQTNSNVAKSTKEVFNTTDPTERIASGGATETRTYVLYTPANYVFYKGTGSYYHYIGTLDPSNEDYYTLRSSIASAWSLVYQCIGSYTNTAEPNYETARAAVGEVSYIPYWETIGAIETSDVSFPFYRIPYGTFVVEDCPRSHGAMTHRRVTARTGGGQLINDGTHSLNQLLGETNPFSKLQCDPYGLLALLDPETFATSFEVDPEYYDTTGGQARMSIYNLFNSSGVEYSISLENNSGDLFHFEGTRLWETGYHDSSDLFKPSFDGDLDTYESFGVWVARQLDDNGLNLTYNKNRVKVYESNEQALRRVAPFLFYPCLSAFDHLGGGQVIGDDFSIKLTSGKIAVVANSQLSSTLDDSGAYIKPAFYGTADRNCAVRVFYCINKSPERIYVERVGSSSSTVVFAEDVPSDLEFTVNVTSRTGYSVIDAATRYTRAPVVLEYTDKKNNYFNYHSRTGSGGDVTKRDNGYQYTNTFDFEKMVQGYLELTGKFFKPSRSGGLTVYEFDNSNPISINMSEYSELWWDEYDVKPIGSVKYQFNDGKDSATYQFGEGESVYDLSDNEYLKTLTNATSDQINAILDELFVPHVQNIIFIPYDMTMVGLPYLETGDYIEVVTGADDVPVVGSYIMHRTLSGINALTDNTEASSGELIEGIEVE